MKKRLISPLLSTLALIAAGPLAAQPPTMSFDDFVPPVAGGPSQPAGEVKREAGAMVAPDAQTGLNHALKALLDSGHNGIKDIQVPSGYAVLSVASEDYRTYDNRNATLLSKRSAYVRAMARAQKQLVENFEGLVNTCNRAVSIRLESRDSGAGGNMTNSATESTESCKEQVSGVLAGYVLYALQDNAPKEKTVTVALASSSKTRTSAQRMGGAVIVAQDPRQAWEALMTEITATVVPPLGARMIVNPTTGETTVVGFGSAIVRQNSDAAVSRKLKEAAQQQALTRANSALVGFLQGDKVYWEGGFDERQVETSEQFEKVQPPGDAPKTGMVENLSRTVDSLLAKGTSVPAETIRPLDKTRSAFLNVFKQSDDIRVVTSGQLPPGVKHKGFVDKEGDWAVAISVYSTSLTERAKAAARENASAVEGSRAPSASGSPAEKAIPGGLNDEAANPHGPSGQVTKPGNL